MFIVIVAVEDDGEKETHATSDERSIGTAGRATANGNTRSTREEPLVIVEVETVLCLTLGITYPRLQPLCE